MAYCGRNGVRGGAEQSRAGAAGGRSRCGAEQAAESGQQGAGQAGAGAARGGDFWHFLGPASVGLANLQAGNPRLPATGVLVVCAARAAMAKWGQGDPRWIVEEREDGTNVNNWHWCGGRAGGRLGLGRGRAPGRAARPCSTLAPGGRRFVTALAFRLRDPESWAKPREGLLPHPTTSVPRSPLSRPSSGLSCVVRVRVCRGM